MLRWMVEVFNRALHTEGDLGVGVLGKTMLAAYRNVVVNAVNAVGAAEARSAMASAPEGTLVHIDATIRTGGKAQKSVSETFVREVRRMGMEEGLTWQPTLTLFVGCPLVIRVKGLPGTAQMGVAKGMVVEVVQVVTKPGAPAVVTSVEEVEAVLVRSTEMPDRQFLPSLAAGHFFIFPRRSTETVVLRVPNPDRPGHLMDVAAKFSVNQLPVTYAYASTVRRGHGAGGGWGVHGARVVVLALHVVRLLAAVVAQCVVACGCGFGN